MISHEHKVIFVHIPKTGGQSIEQMFLSDLGLSWEDRAPLLLRANSDPEKGPSRMAHLYADEYVRLGYVTQEQFDTYFKFAVVRDPHARLVSEYLYRMQRYPRYKQPPSWWFARRQFANDYEDIARHMETQSRYVMNASGKMLVDKIIRFEELGQEMLELSKQIFGEPRPLPHRNKSGGAKRDALRKLMVQWLIKGVSARRYRDDFEAFDYPV